MAGTSTLYQTQHLRERLSASNLTLTDGIDELCWCPETSGHPLGKAVAQGIRKFLISRDKNIPLKYSYLTWRCVRGGLPVDTNIRRLGVELVSKCHC